MKKRDAHQATAVAAESLSLPQHGGVNLIMDYLFTVAPSLCFISLFLEFHPLYYHRAKNLVSTFSLSGVLQGNITCFLGHLWERPSLGEIGRRFFSSSLFWFNLECVVAQLLRWSFPLGQSRDLLLSIQQSPILTYLFHLFLFHN